MADNRGGPRQGTPGVPYPNRSDMRAPGARITPSNLPASGQYGQGAQQARALAVTPTAGPSPSPQTAAQPQPQLAPGDIPGLADPTGNPDEPVTAGLPIGPGVGSDGLHVAVQDSPELAVARALYLQYPNPDIRRYIAFLEDTLQFNA